MRGLPFSLSPAEGERAGVRGPTLFVAPAFARSPETRFVPFSNFAFAALEFVPEFLAGALVPFAVES